MSFTKEGMINIRSSIKRRGTISQRRNRVRYERWLFCDLDE